MKYAKLTALLLSLLLSFGLGAEPPADLAKLGWKAKRQPRHHEDVSTFVSKVDGYAVKAFRGTVQMPYSVDQIVSLLKDHQRLPEWIFQSKAVQEHLIPDHKAVLLQFNGVWPVSDRDVLIDYDYIPDAESGGMRLYVYSIDKLYPKQRKFVRIPILDNRWHIFPVRPGWSEVHFETFIDVGGSIPKWIANIVANDAPRRTLRGMRKMLDTGHYGPASVPLEK